MELKKIKLAECCLSISDGDHQPPPKINKGVPFVTIANITRTNQFDFSHTMFVPNSYYENLDEKRKAKIGDVLYSVVGSFGIPVLIKQENPFVFQRHIAILRPDIKQIDSRYLYYTMLSRDFYAKVDAVAVGAAQRTVSLSSLRNIEVFLPEMKIQRRIADILSAYDNLIENNQKQIKLLEEAAQRLYKEWFIDLRFPGYESVKIIDGVPEGWGETTIDSFIQLQSGFAFKSNTFTDEGKYKIVTIKNVQDGKFDGNNVNKIAEIPQKMPKHCELQEGDILLSLTGNVGRVCIVDGENYLLNQRVAKLYSDNPCFTYCLFKSNKMFQDMNNLANGVAQQNLSPVRTGQMKIIKADYDIMEKFESIEKPILKKIIALNKENRIALQARNRLLPKLMSGEIEV